MNSCTARPAAPRSDELDELGIKMTSPKARVAAAAQTGPLAGKTLVVTGTLPTYGREEIEAADHTAGRPRIRQRLEKDRLCRGRREGRQQARQSAQARRQGADRGRI